MNISAIDPLSSSALGSTPGAVSHNSDITLNEADPVMAEMNILNSEMNLLNAQQQAQVRDLMRRSETDSLMNFLKNMTLQSEVSITNREAEAQLKRLTGKFELIQTMLQKLS